MPIEVEIEGVGTAEFPDDTPKDVIQKTVRRKLAETQQHKASFGRLREAEAEIDAKKKAKDEENQRIYDSLAAGMSNPDSWSGGTDMELVKQAADTNKKIAGTMAGIYAPFLAEAAIPALALPAATSRAGLALRLAAQGAIGAGAQSGVENAIDVAEGSKTVPEALKSTALNTAGGAVAGPVIGIPAMKAAGALSGAVEAGAGNRLRGAYAGLSRPLVQSEDQAAKEAARAFIEAQSGKRPLTSLGQELNERKFLGAGNAAAIEEEIARKGGKAVSPTPDERSGRIEDIFKSATKLANSGDDSTAIANRLKEALKSEVGEVTGPAEKAVDDFAETLKGAQDTTRKAVAAEAEGVVGPGTATQDAFDTKAREAIQSSFDAKKKAYDELYAAARSSPAYKAAVTDEEAIKPLREWAEKEGNFGLKDAQGEVVSGSTVPRQNAGIAGLINQAGDKQDLEYLRMWRSQVGENLFNDGFMPGVGAASKKRLYGAIGDTIKNVVNKLPDSSVKENLQKANRLFGQTADELDLSVAKGALKTEGESGALVGGGLFDRLTKNPEDLRAFKNILKDEAPAQIANLRSAFAKQAIEQSTKIGEEGSQLSVGELFKKVSGLPEEIRAEIVPGYSKLQSLAEREAKLAGFKDPKRALELFQADPKAFEGVLEGTATPKAVAAASDVLATEAAKQKKLSNSILNEAYKGNFDLINKSPANFMKRVLGGEFSTEREIPYLFSQISKHDPALVGDLQTEFLSDLLQSSKSGGIIDGRKVSKAIASPSAGTAGSSGGDKYSLAVEILGKPKVEQMQGIAKALEKADEASFIRQLADENVAVSTGAYIAGKVAGEGVAMRPASNIIGQIIPTIRLKVASAILNDNALRQLAAKPMSELTKAEAATLSNAAQRYAQEYLSSENKRGNNIPARAASAVSDAAVGAKDYVIDSAGNVVRKVIGR